MKPKLAFIITAIACVFALAYISGCKKLTYVTATTSDVNIYDYLLKNPDQFSEFAKMVDKAGYSGFLNAYGTYTLFAPTNDGVKAFLTETGKASVDAFTAAELQNIVKLHLIKDTINTSVFTDGKLPHVTMLGQYLLTGVSNENGVSSYTVNRQALILQPNIFLSNGNVHVIDHVLKAATKTAAQTVEASTDFSIFTQALKETGYYDSLNILNNPDTTRRFLTVVAETNKALADSGITTYAALKAKYSKTGDPKRADDSLHMYVAYHIFTDARYLADIISSPSIPTLQPLEVVTTKLDGQDVLLNDISFNGKYEPGVKLQRSTSDVTASNGVVHSSTAHFAVKIRVPVRVDFDVADQPELRKLTNVYRQVTTANAITSTGGGTVFAKGAFADITWNANTSTTSTISYCCIAATSTTQYGWRADYLRFPMGNTSRNLWVELRTPLLVKGRYKVWISYYRGKASANNPAFPNRVDFDGQPMQRTFDFSAQKPTGTTGELEALGYKQYTEVATTNTGQDLNNVSRLLGTVDVQTTDRHLVRITFLANSTGQELNYLDMIQFIPVNDNQQRPIFGRDGSIIP
ncbi:fasciclin domain-containing protein [Pinibacter soli]|uniref:Fasciclin domain-containing protein n=1 Tax=Pinibacter soli TaxID=3044211 RepID=A0ABT6R9P6_9BACT|nr:fasciclin domain-containing protein [Pinibacter soli]MDI3319283.1 fasciclin domain-containing protein [Pinibacter soli]